MHIQRSAVSDVICAPDLSKQLVAGKRHAGVREEQTQQADLAADDVRGECYGEYQENQ